MTSASATLTIRPAIADDLDIASQLLAEADLPVADLSVQRLALVAEKDEIIQGVIGVEVFDDVALLRSLVISPRSRGAGIGPALVTALEVASLTQSVREMWLLTIDADAFFAKLGYHVQSRSRAPEAIQSTEEFSDLCPGDAVLMSKKLMGSGD